jgi:hypothetical protein
MAADDDLSAVDLVQALEPGREIHGVSHRAIVEALLGADVADQH